MGEGRKKRSRKKIERIGGIGHRTTTVEKGHRGFWVVGDGDSSGLWSPFSGFIGWARN